MKQKGFSEILAILIIAVIAGGGFVLWNMSKTQDSVVPSSTSIPATPNSQVKSTPTLTYTLPQGWKNEYNSITSEDNGEFMSGVTSETYSFTKGGYILTINTPLYGGRGACGSYEKEEYKTLNNKLLGNLVVRDIPGKESLTSGILDVCSDHQNAGIPEENTKIGSIKYSLPTNWDETSLTEMDTIVESLR